MNGRNPLFIKASLTLFFVLALVGCTYLLITWRMADQYVDEINQRLYGRIADSTATHVPMENGVVDTADMHHLMHSMMMINPSVEVYLLDSVGNITSYVVPHKKVVREKVDLKPLLTFIEAEEKPFIKGDDPRNLDEQKVFSAAPILKEGKLQGYVYIILASAERAAVTGGVTGSYIQLMGTQYFFVALAVALGLGLLVIWYSTRSLRDILEVFQRFRDGDQEARIPDHMGKDWYPLAETFNSMADTLVANIEKIRSVDRFRQELIANVSHDLRTPLAVIQGYLETLLIKNDTLSPENRKQYLGTSIKSIHRLTKLIGQLFEYSKLEALQIQPQKEAFFLTELVHDVKYKYQILAEDKEIVLTVEHPENVPLVFADIGMVERVIQNLLDNAIKHTPSGGEVKLELAENHQGVQVRVVDTGPGIPKDKQSFIFERYNKLANAKGGNGTGLGLAIVKKILELHETTIEVQSKVNQGASFSFSLPSYSQHELAMG
ncbi:MAG: HAMP domain-containing sensor histidine kinase [Bacteroidota bacterium]